MKHRNEYSRTTRRHPLGGILATVFGGSAALTVGLAAVSPDAVAPHSPSVLGGAVETERIAVSMDLEALRDHVNQVMKLEASRLQHVNVQPDQPLEGELNVMVDGELMTLTYWPHSVRSDDFRVWKQIDDGSLVEIEPTPERTIRGVIEDLPGSNVAGALLESGLHAGFNLPDGRTLWIEPIVNRVEGADEGLHVLYDTEDAHCDDGTCGAPHHWLDRFHGHDIEPKQGDELQFASDCRVAEIAFDADVQFFTWLNSSTSQVTNYINNIVNAINNNQYEDQVGIIHEITEIVIRTSFSQNPYSSSDPVTLLNQFRDVWRTSPESSIPRDMAHLMTGRNMGNVLGVAWLGTVCQSIHGNHYGLSRNMSQFSCQTDLVAHETGHNWNAGHCSCSNSTMNSSITCSNTFTGAGSNSINQILNYKNSVACLEPCAPPQPPENNECQNSIVVGEGSTEFTNVNATTAGPAESTDCSFEGDDQVQSDVWFEYTASCSGEVTFSLCDGDQPTEPGACDGNCGGQAPSGCWCDEQCDGFGDCCSDVCNDCPGLSFCGGGADSEGFDTKLAVYGASCPTSSGSVIDCNKDDCGSLSEVTISATAGDVFKIRIGGHNGETGSGILTIDCEPVDEPDDCPADLTGTGEVDTEDLFELLAVWGSCPGCDADLNGDDIVDTEDLFELLAAWGNCP